MLDTLIRGYSVTTLGHYVSAYPLNASTYPLIHLVNTHIRFNIHLRQHKKHTICLCAGFKATEDRKALISYPDLPRPRQSETENRVRSGYEIRKAHKRGNCVSTYPEMPTSGNLKSGDSFFCITPPPNTNHQPP